MTAVAVGDGDLEKEGENHRPELSQTLHPRTENHGQRLTRELGRLPQIDRLNTPT